MCLLKLKLVKLINSPVAPKGATSHAVRHVGNVLISMDLCEQLIEVITTRQVVSDAVRDRISGLST